MKSRKQDLARAAVGHAVHRGHMVKPDRCQRCGAQGPLEGHHYDYDKQTDVIWLCIPCHKEIHGVYINRDVKIQKAIRLREKGETYKAIAKELSMSKSQIYKWLNDKPYD